MHLASQLTLVGWHDRRQNRAQRGLCERSRVVLGWERERERERAWLLLSSKFRANSVSTGAYIRRVSLYSTKTNQSSRVTPSVIFLVYRPSSFVRRASSMIPAHHFVPVSEPPRCPASPASRSRFTYASIGLRTFLLADLHFHPRDHPGLCKLNPRGSAPPWLLHVHYRHGTSPRFIIMLELPISVSFPNTIHCVTARRPT